MSKKIEFYLNNEEKSNTLYLILVFNWSHYNTFNKILKTKNNKPNILY